MESANIAGEYYLQGMQEMASGFLLKPDNSFQFFFMYGALDRYGSGTWTEKDGRVIINSDAKPADGYTLVSSTKKEQDHISIKLEGNNPMALRHTFTTLDHTVEGSWKELDQQGEVKFPKQQLDSISLLLEFCPEKIATIPVNKEHNEFVFRIEQSILEVFFDNFTLNIEEDILTGDHPVLNSGTFKYERQ